MIAKTKIAFVGAGFMGKALIAGLIESGTVKPDNIVAADSSIEALRDIENELKIRTTSNNCDAVAGADIVVMCVKPQVMESVIGEIKTSLDDKTLILSIAAGVTLGSLVSWVPIGCHLIRAMPNLGAAVGASATALCIGAACDDNDIAIAKEFFEAVGKAVVVNEDMMDAVTGLSGSGPGFIFLYLEAMIEAGVRCGLPKEAASILAKQTLYGSALLAITSEKEPQSLRNQVTSPGGTTMAGLAILEKSMFQSSIIDAIEGAVKRSKELGGD